MKTSYVGMSDAMTPYRNIDEDEARRVPGAVRSVTPSSHRDDFTGLMRYSVLIRFDNGTAVDFYSANEVARDAFAAAFAARIVEAA